MSTRVCHCVGDQECFFSRATMAIVPGEKSVHKRLNQTAANLPPASVSLEAAVVSLVSFCFPSLVAGNNLNPDSRFSTIYQMK
jgi:hypothetical protein